MVYEHYLELMWLVKYDLVTVTLGGVMSLLRLFCRYSNLVVFSLHLKQNSLNN